MTLFRAVWVVAVLWPVLAGAAPPVVSNVRAAQRAGTELVDLYYDLAAGVPPVAVAVQISADGGATSAVPAVSLTGDLGSGLQPGANKHLVWNAGADWDGQFSAQVKFKLTATDLSTPCDSYKRTKGQVNHGRTFPSLLGISPFGKSVEEP